MHCLTPKRFCAHYPLPHALVCPEENSVGMVKMGGGGGGGGWNVCVCVNYDRHVCITLPAAAHMVIWGLALLPCLPGRMCYSLDMMMIDGRMVFLPATALLCVPPRAPPAKHCCLLACLRTPASATKRKKDSSLGSGWSLLLSYLTFFLLLWGRSDFSVLETDLQLILPPTPLYSTTTQF